MAGYGRAVIRHRTRQRSRKGRNVDNGRSFKFHSVIAKTLTSPDGPAHRRGRGTANDARARRPKDRAERIVDAAVDLFARRGYHSVSMDEIGESVQITGSAVYRHFKNKDALLFAAVKHVMLHIDREVELAVTGATDSRTKIERIAATTVDIALAQRDLFAIYVRERRHVDHEQVRDIARLQLRLADRWSQTLRELTDAPRDDLEFAIVCASGVVNSVVFDEPPLPDSKLRPIVRDALVRALVAPWEVAAETSPPRQRDLHQTGALRPTSQRERVLGAAIELFGHLGFPAVTIDAIGAAAGTKGPNIYRHFASKQHLLAAAFHRWHEQRSAAVNWTLAHSRTPTEALGLLVDRTIELALDNPRLVQISTFEQGSLADADRAEAERRDDEHIEEWTRLARSVRPEWTNARARCLVSAAVYLLNTSAATRGSLALDRRRKHQLLREMALAALDLRAPAFE